MLSEGLRPPDSPTRSVARRFVGALRTRDSLAVARSLLLLERREIRRVEEDRFRRLGENRPAGFGLRLDLLPLRIGLEGGPVLPGFFAARMLEDVDERGL